MTAEIPATALDTLPIFPLPQAVLFPGMILPLHVFEQRYRDLTRDVLAGHRVMAVPRLRPGHEEAYAGSPPIFETAGVGYVVADNELPDGRFNLVLRGVARVRIEEELAYDRAYRVVRARILSDEPTARPAVVSALQVQIVALCERLAGSLGEAGQRLSELVRGSLSPSSCADMLGAALVADPDQRQALLEALDPADRLETVLAVLSGLVSQFGPSSEALN
jgi:Lon protease-like protein